MTKEDLIEIGIAAAGIVAAYFAASLVYGLVTSGLSAIAYGPPAPCPRLEVPAPEVRFNVAPAPPVTPPAGPAA